MGPFGRKDTVFNSGVLWEIHILEAGGTPWGEALLLCFAHISALAHCSPSGL